MCGLWRSPSVRHDDLGIKANRAARWATGRGQKKSSRPVGREDCTRVLRPYRSPAHEGSTAHSSGRSSDSWALNLLPAPSHAVIPAVALCGFRSHLQRRDREGFEPSSLRLKCYRRRRHSTEGRIRCQWVGLRLGQPGVRDALRDRRRCIPTGIGEMEWLFTGGIGGCRMHRPWATRRPKDHPRPNPREAKPREE